MIRCIALTLGLVCITGCATTTPVNVAGRGTQLETRQIQTRQYDTLDKALSMRSVIATLQDLGFTIDQADTELGVISATRRDRNTMRMTVTVVQRGEEQVSVRANARLGEQSVHAAETYQDFFIALDKAMFLTSQNVD